jgi:hypothetical protein
MLNWPLVGVLCYFVVVLTCCVVYCTGSSTSRVRPTSGLPVGRTLGAVSISASDLEKLGIRPGAARGLREPLLQRESQDEDCCGGAAPDPAPADKDDGGELSPVGSLLASVSSPQQLEATDSLALDSPSSWRPARSTVGSTTTSLNGRLLAQPVPSEGARPAASIVPAGGGWLAAARQAGMRAARRCVAGGAAGAAPAGLQAPPARPRRPRRRAGPPAKPRP